MTNTPDSVIDQFEGGLRNYGRWRVRAESEDLDDAARQDAALRAGRAYDQLVAAFKLVVERSVEAGL